MTQDTFAAILESEIETLYRVAKRMTLNDSDAEDIVGQTILNSLKNCHQFDGNHPRSWLIKILNNEWLYLLRKRKVRKEEEIVEENESDVSDYWKPIQDRILFEDVVKALDLMADEFRIAVTLCDMEEFTYSAAAEIIGVPVGTIRSRVFRGRRLLRHQLVHLMD